MKKFLSLIHLFVFRFVLSLLLLFSINLNASIFNEREPASVVIDYNSGSILSSYKEDNMMHPASLTKIMTLYVIFDKLSNNEAKLSDLITISNKAASMPPTKLGLSAGSKITLKDAILAVIVKSSNDIAYAIAEHYSPDNTAQGFVDLMNAKLEVLQLKNTHYENPTGLHHSNQYTTALDMAKLARYLMIHHNSYYALFGVSNFKWDYRRYSSTNHLLKYNGIDGIKTGYTYASGFNLITSATNENTRIIAVTLGFDSSKNRDDYMKTIVEEGFQLAKSQRLSTIKYFTKPVNLKNNNINLATESTNNMEYNIINVNYDQIQPDNTEIDSYDDSTLDSIKKPNNISNKKAQSTSTIQSNKQNTDLSLFKRNNGSYGINPIDGIDELTTDNYEISPYYKAIKTTKSAKYTIQVGAFSTKKAAINASYSMPKNTLSPQQAYIDKKNGFYVVKFRGLSKNKAYSTCATLKKQSRDCIVFNS